MATKTKTRMKAPALEAVEPAPLAAPETEAERVRRLIDAMYKKDPPKEAREEFRALLSKTPEMARLMGTLPGMARGQGLARFEALPALEESLKFQLKQLRKELAGPKPSPLETLLVDVVLYSYQDYYLFGMVYGQRTGESFTLRDMEKWERILASKEGRYLRAIGELARVRRLLNLPAPQVNINLPGGQQVNVNGDVRP